MPGSPKLYHHTSLAHLPYILMDGALVPSPSPSKEWPRDLVWATADERGDRTTAICGHAHQTSVPHVRITLKPDLFRPWQQVADDAGWDKKTRDVLILAADAMGQRDTSGWYACLEEVSTDQVVSMEMRTWSSPWQSVRLDRVAVVGDVLTFDAGGRPWLVAREIVDGWLRYFCREGFLGGSRRGEING